jgi:hypothetical protein
MELRWVKDHDEKYSAYSGNHTYIVRLFNVGAYDGDPTLTIYDDRYRSTCWSLTTRVGAATRHRVRLFNDLSSALFAAQVAEDNARDHQPPLPRRAPTRRARESVPSSVQQATAQQHLDVGDRPGRHRRGVDDAHTATITGRDGKTYTYWTRLPRR